MVKDYSSIIYLKLAALHLDYEIPKICNSEEYLEKLMGNLEETYH